MMDGFFRTGGISSNKRKLDSPLYFTSEDRYIKLQEEGDIAFTKGEELLELIEALHNVSGDDALEKLDQINQLLQEEEIYVSMSDASGDTPLHAAVRLQSEESGILIKDLLDKNANINKPNDRGETPLHVAVGLYSANSVDIATRLLERGAYINQPNKQGEAPLSIAIKASNLTGEEDNHEKTPFAMVILLLKQNNIDVRIKDRQGNTPLHIALQTAREETDFLVKQLVKKGTYINSANDHGETPLIVALKSKAIREVIDCLLKYQVIDVNQSDSDGNTALHLAIYRGDFSLIQCLVEKGANINAQNKQGNTPLDLAMQDANGKENIIDYLRQRHALEEKVQQLLY